jgi:hypothetical protein
LEVRGGGCGGVLCHLSAFSCSGGGLLGLVVICDQPFIGGSVGLKDQKHGRTEILGLYGFMVFGVQYSAGISYFMFYILCMYMRCRVTCCSAE